MKKTSLLLLICSLIVGSGFPLQAQNTLQLNLQHTVFGNPLDFQSFADIFGTNLEVNRLEYYLSDFVITHDGGQETLLEEVFLLVDAEGSNVTYSLGEWNIDSVESLAFHVGINEDFNHLDPSAYAEGHPLAPQNPSMHWGWASGYIFVALEGVTQDNNSFQIHALGDDNFYDQSHELSAEAMDGTIDLFLRAKCENMFIQVDVSDGLIEHSTINEAATILNNMRDFVFEPIEASTGIEQKPKQTCSFYPNPSKGRVQIDWEPNAIGSNYVLLDANGRICRRGEITEKSEVWNTATLFPGVYILVAHGEANFHKRLVIQ
jgi:hypothetical protein